MRAFSFLFFCFTIQAKYEYKERVYGSPFYRLISDLLFMILTLHPRCAFHPVTSRAHAHATACSRSVLIKLWISFYHLLPNLVFLVRPNINMFLHLIYVTSLSFSPAALSFDPSLYNVSKKSVVLYRMVCNFS